MFDDVTSELSAQLADFYDQAELETLFASLPPVDTPPERTEEFWLQHKRTVAHRYYAYALAKSNLDLSILRNELSDSQAFLVSSVLTELADQDVRYPEIRLWWLRGGSFRHALAVQARRERERHAKAAFAALFFFEGARPKWLSYGESGLPVLVNEKNEAYRFTRQGLVSVDAQLVENLSQEFSYLCHELKATSVKLLPF